MQIVKHLIAPGIFVLSVLVMVHGTTAQQMAFPGTEWETATPESVLVDSAKLARAVAYLQRTNSSPGVDEMVIIRNGRIIWQGPHAQNSHHLFSVTKSFASTALGLLIDDGLVTLNTPAMQYVPSMAADYPDVTMRHFVTHTSGYLAEEEIYPDTITVYPEYPFDPVSPLFSPPGSQFAYSNTSMDQMMNVLTRVAGEPLQDIFQRRIGDPIGLEPGLWDWTDYETTVSAR